MSLMRAGRLLAIMAMLGVLMAVFPATLLAEDGADTCGLSADEELVLAGPAPGTPSQAELAIAFVTAQAGGGVVTGSDVKGTCNARDIQFFQNRLDRAIIMMWKVTNRGECELVITGSWGDIRVQREGLVDASSSQAWLAQVAAGESVKYSCRGADATRTCAFTYQMEVVQVLSS